MIVPAPWKLKGYGYIVLYKLDKDFVAKNGRVPEYLQGSFLGGFGALMVVNYQSSNVGPYGELLFMPGSFRFRGKRKKSITQIYVSSTDSVESGRANWGIPKALAGFSASVTGTGVTGTSTSGDRFVFSHPADPCRVIADLEFKSFGPKFPVNTKLLPFPLVQHLDNMKSTFLLTEFKGRGWGQLARLKHQSFDSDLFVDLGGVKPLVAIRVEPFDIEFPRALVAE